MCLKCMRKAGGIRWLVSADITNLCISFGGLHDTSRHAVVIALSCNIAKMAPYPT
jgi:hypothetical protein